MKFKTLFIFSGILFLLASILGSPVIAKDNSPQDIASASEISADTTAVADTLALVDSLGFLTLEDILDIHEPKDTVLRAAIVLADIYGNRDNEFTRGFLLGLQNVNLPDHSLSLKVINGAIPLDSLIFELDEFMPDVIFSTGDKETPELLIDYSVANGLKLFNVFDAKGEEYLSLPDIYQLLSPSQIFNENSAKYIEDNFGDNILLLVGTPDMGDQILKNLILDWPEDQLMLIKHSDLVNFQLDEGTNYLVYPILETDKEFPNFMKEVKEIINRNPFSGIRVIGRPNWITFNELNNNIENVEVLIPSKCYFDKTSEEARRFISDYKSRFKHTPLISYPVYAVMGYDVARYFIPTLIDDLRYQSETWPAENMLQSYFYINDKGEEKGYYNSGTYMLHYVPGRKMQKLLVN